MYISISLSKYICMYLYIYIYVYSSTVAYGSGTTNWVIVNNPFQPWIMEYSDSCQCVGMFRSEKKQEELVENCMKWYAVLILRYKRVVN